MSVDTCSKAVWATAAVSTAFPHVRRHWLAAFAALGVPASIKTDNGSAYVSRAWANFLETWHITHITGILHNSTGQAIIERRHQDLKRLVSILKKEGELSPHDALMKACYVLNWKNPVGPDPGAIPMQTHLRGNLHDFSQHQVQVLVWNPDTEQWEGPHVLLTWGKGYACVVIGQQTRWVPAKWVKPWIPAGNENKSGDDSGSSHSAQD